MEENVQVGGPKGARGLHVIALGDVSVAER
jgi:hypothetical protein